MSRDIPDNLCALSWSFLGLVVLGGVDGELGEEFAVFVDDAHVAVGDEQHDAGGGVAAADAEVAELRLIAQGDVAAAVDAVELPGHLRRAVDNGVTQDELVEVITHLAFYSGWPTAMSAVGIAKKIFEAD